MAQGENPAEALFLVAVVEMAPGHVDAGREYEDAVLAVLHSYGGTVERRLYSTDGGATEVQLIRFTSRAGYEAALADPDRLALRAQLGAAAPTTRVIEVHDPRP
ncbi:hypothetical protein Cs7R123_53100 [Catellatospora sp. TT07R-123]|uniref:hypothetical protein n=1 Tax=Catellatospora sp. TT07R-123 TaxID=2733863 RepID=UPI001AFFEE76|nr:hypothetical protein [Catellatospora sp. TT07R-123]GHJ47968.1 hypothetical protein Cs7R123_53100 [Catellatospora sp. TT07R-123]